MTQLVHVAVVAALTVLIVTGHLDPEAGVAYIVGATVRSPVDAIRNTVAKRREKAVDEALEADADPRSVPDA